MMETANSRQERAKIREKRISDALIFLWKK
jgi:hypothetical protein